MMRAGEVSAMRALLGVVCGTAFLAGCLAKAGPGGDPVAPGGSPPAGGAIEAGCTFRGTDLKGDPGATFQVACPAGCTEGSLWGTEVYTADSAVCVAAV